MMIEGIQARPQATSEIALQAVVVPSPYARASIATRSASAALEIEGVRDVLFASHVPGDNIWKGESPLLAVDEVEYAGQAVAVVIGETLAACRAAVDRLEIEYHPLPGVLDLEHAEVMKAYHGEPRRLEGGDVAAALAGAARTVEGVVLTGAQDHLTPVPAAAFAAPRQGGGVDLWLETEEPDGVRSTVAANLGIVENGVLINNLARGSNLQGKQIDSRLWATLAAVAACRLEAPVRLQFSHAEDLAWSGKRRPVEAKFIAGFDADGRVEALRINLLVDGGAWDLDARERLGQILLHLDNAYQIPNFEFVGRAYRTNFPPASPVLGGGAAEGIAIVEEIMSRVAVETKLPAERVRRRNFYRFEGSEPKTPCGQAAPARMLDRVWLRIVENARIELRREEIAAENEKAGYLRKGLGVVPVKYGVGQLEGGSAQVTALLNVCGDGSVQIHVPGGMVDVTTEIRVRETISTRLGVASDSIAIHSASQAGLTNAMPNVAAAESGLHVRATLAACRNLEEQLKPLCLQLLAERGAGPGSADDLAFAGFRVFLRHNEEISVSFIELVAKAHELGSPLSAIGYARVPGRFWNTETLKGQPFERFVVAACSAEVEVDTLTGGVRLIKLSIVQDRAGRDSFELDEDLIESGFRFGFGWLIRERLNWDESGALNPDGYAIPTIGDLPADFEISSVELDDSPSQFLLGSPFFQSSVPLALAVREAIKDALAGAGFLDQSESVPFPIGADGILSVLRAT
ncbi:MAG: xanthine dehydrogenase large subunit [Verrucomicrobiales bacterium]|jgi:xanthine dehydrogenase large subunit